MFEVTGGDRTGLQLIIFVIISEELTKELESKTYLNPPSTKYFVKVPSGPGAMCQRKVLTDKSHYSNETKSSSITWRHVGLHNRCISNHELICRGRQDNGQHTFIAPNFLNGAGIVVFISHKVPDDVRKNDTSHNETVARDPGAVPVSTGSPGADRVARTRVTGVRYA